MSQKNKSKDNFHSHQQLLPAVLNIFVTSIQSSFQHTSLPMFFPRHYGLLEKQRKRLYDVKLCPTISQMLHGHTPLFAVYQFLE